MWLEEDLTDWALAADAEHARLFMVLNCEKNRNFDVCMVSRRNSFDDTTLKLQVGEVQLVRFYCSYWSRD